MTDPGNEEPSEEGQDLFAFDQSMPDIVANEDNEGKTVPENSIKYRTVDENKTITDMPKGPISVMFHHATEPDEAATPN